MVVNKKYATAYQAIVRILIFHNSMKRYNQIEVLSKLAADCIKPDRMHFVNGAFNLF